MMVESRPDPTYILGSSTSEQSRLQQQGDLFAPMSERLLRAAGIGAGMRVLDVGCGVGDLSLLCAELVGQDGEVVGVERDAAALETARRRVAAAGLEHVRLVEGDYRELSQGEPFDAIIGRFVLMYAVDPVAALRALRAHARRGGIVAFQEFDFTAVPMWPRMTLFEQVLEWWRRTAREAGIELQMGLKLSETYLAAGLLAPTLQGDFLIGGGPEFAGYGYLAGIMRSILPRLEQYGIASAAEVDVETLAERLRAEAVANNGVISLALVVGAATRSAT